MRIVPTVPQATARNLEGGRLRLELDAQRIETLLAAASELHAVRTADQSRSVPSALFNRVGGEHGHDPPDVEGSATVSSEACATGGACRIASLANSR
jgi:hypothetical protein